MRRIAALMSALFLILVAAACDSLPGLRVLQGADDPQTLADSAVAAGDLVMADKANGTDPAIVAVGDRIEAAANGTIDVVEIRAYPEEDMFYVDMLFNPPAAEGAEGQIAQLEAIRRAFELAWLGGMPFSDGMGTLYVSLMVPQDITTIDTGTAYVGFVVAEGSIERSLAQAYLDGERSLNTFFDMIVDGTFQYQQLDEPAIYAGTPNHPLFLLSADVPGA